MSSIAVRGARFGSPPRGVVVQAAAGVAVALLAAGLTTVLDRRGVGIGIAAGAAASVVAWLFTTRHTQLALALFLVYVGALDGYVKLATGVAGITLVRDVLLFGVVVGVLVRAQVQGRKLRLPPLSAWVCGFVVVIFVQLFNPQAGTLGHSLAGLRQHLEFVPLFFLTFAFVRTTRALRWFVVLILLVATANGTASWVQFNLAPKQFASWGPGYAERVLGKGGFANAGRTFADTADKNRTRPFGLGSDAGSGGIMGALALGGVLALASLAGRRRYLLFAVAMAIGALAAILTSQGRGVIVVSVVIVLAYALLTITSGGSARGMLAIAMGGILAVVGIQAILGSTAPSAFRYEGLSATNIVQTTTHARPGNGAAILTAITSYPLGAGLGTGGPASGSPGATELAYTVNTESELSFMTAEAGIAGMLLIVGFTVSLFVLGVTRLRQEPDREARLLLTALISPVAGMIALYYPSGVTAATPAGPYLWAIGGIVSYWLVARPAERRE
jgi:hypothetical protein